MWRRAAADGVLVCRLPGIEVPTIAAHLDTAPSGPGRPRDRALDGRILDELIALLGSHGYTGLTLQELAERSGVAKTTILRRWPSKAAVAAAAVERLALASVDLPDSGSLRGDLRALLGAAVKTFVRGRGSFVPRLFRESGHHPEINDLLSAILDTRRQAYRRIVARAIDRGELAPSVDQELLIDLLIGPLWTRLLITRSTVTAGYVRSNVEAVLTAFAIGELATGRRTAPKNDAAARKRRSPSPPPRGERTGNQLRRRNVHDR